MTAYTDQSNYAVRGTVVNFVRNLFGLADTKHGQAKQWQDAQKRRKNSRDRRNDRYI